MISKEMLQHIEYMAKELFEKLGGQTSICLKSNEDGSVSVEAKTDEPQMLIGENGQALLEIQHVLRSMVRKKIGEPLWLLLDINDYRKSKEAYLKQLASSAADDVALLHKEKELPPMNAQDRRIVHVAISQRQDVVSESTGEGPERRVVIKPKIS